MLNVNIEKILPVTEVRDSLNRIIDEVEGSDELYVVTKNGKPSAILVGVHHLEKLTGLSHKEIMPDDMFTQNQGSASVPADQTNAMPQDSSAATPLAPVADDSAMPSAPAADIATSMPSSPLTAPSDQTQAPAPAAAPFVTPTMGTEDSATAANEPMADASAPAPAATPTSEPPVDDADDIFGPVDEPDLATPAAPSAPTEPTATPAPAPTMPPAPAPMNNQPVATPMPPIPPQNPTSQQ